MGYAATAAREATFRKFSNGLDEVAEPVASLNVVIVSADVAMSVAMTEILQKCFVRVILANGFRELKSVCSRITPNVCLCGFELADGTSHDVVEYLEHQPSPTPVIMVSAPSVGEPSEHLLDSIRAGALATICYPYRLSEVQLMVWTVIQCQREFGRMHGHSTDTGIGAGVIAMANR